MEQSRPAPARRSAWTDHNPGPGSGVQVDRRRRRPDGRRGGAAERPAGARERHAGADRAPRRRLGRQRGGVAGGLRRAGDVRRAARGTTRSAARRSRSSRRRGVDARVALDPERPTGTCLVLVEPGGERTMVPDAGANDALVLDDAARRHAPAPRRLHAAARGLARGRRSPPSRRRASAG